jgi:hypothetical protein
LIRRFPQVPLDHLQRSEPLLTLGTALRENRQLADSRTTLEAALQDLDVYLRCFPRSFVVRNRRHVLLPSCSGSRIFEPLGVNWLPDGNYTPFSRNAVPVRRLRPASQKPARWRPRQFTKGGWQCSQWE